MKRPQISESKAADARWTYQPGVRPALDRRAKVGPAGLLDRRGELQGYGSFGRDDDAESIATLSGLFLEMGYRLGIEIPKDVTEDQLGAPIPTLGGRNV
jgi:hypothetical protein